MAKWIVTWKGNKKDGSDALLTGFDTVLESRAYALGFIDAICMFSKCGEKERPRLLKEIRVRSSKDVGKQLVSSTGNTDTKTRSKPNKTV